MSIQPRIITLESHQLVGMSLKMSLTNNKTFQLWSKFGPRIKEIKNRVSNDKFSLQVYNPNHFKNFNPKIEFVKWAAVAVTTLDQVPNGLESFFLEGGLYAVFDYKGAANDGRIFRYIYSQWIPNSDYTLDQRPHFELLGEKYKNNDPNSEEEIWIPIRKR